MVGCGLWKSYIYFTLNGEYQGLAFETNKIASDLYPVIGSGGSPSRIMANFDSFVFKFDVKKVEQVCKLDNLKGKAKYRWEKESQRGQMNVERGEELLVVFKQKSNWFYCHSLNKKERGFLSSELLSLEEENSNNKKEEIVLEEKRKEEKLDEKGAQINEEKVQVNEVGGENQVSSEVSDEGEYEYEYEMEEDEVESEEEHQQETNEKENKKIKVEKDERAKVNEKERVEKELKEEENEVKEREEREEKRRKEREILENKEKEEREKQDKENKEKEETIKREEREKREEGRRFCE